MEVIDCFGNDFWTFLHSFSVGRIQVREFSPPVVPLTLPPTPTLNEKKCGRAGAKALETRASFLNKLYLVQSLLSFCIILSGLFKFPTTHLFFLVSIGPYLTWFEV